MLATRLDPAIVIDFDADLPRSVIAGVYPVERTPDTTFAWTAGSATLTLRGLDRSVAWTCDVRARAARPAAEPPVDLIVAVDGITAFSHRAGDAYADVSVPVPAREAATSTTLSLNVSPTFVPSPSDRRALGVQVDRIACAPLDGAAAWPPASALVRQAIAGAAFGGLFAVFSPTLLTALAWSIVFGAGSAAVLVTGVALYARPYLEWMPPLALWIAVPPIAFAVRRFWSSATLSPAAGFVVAFSASAVFLKLLALLHPSKEVVDAVFHAHRLGWVLDGRFYFTQPMPGGVQFPYAIGLYATAAPLAALFTDHVALLRIVVVAAEAIAALFVYRAVAVVWRDSSAGAAAAVLYHTAVLPYVVIGNANLTYAFGQSIAVMAVCAAVLLADGARSRASLGALLAITTLAFLSHVGIFPILAVTLVAFAGFRWIAGDRSARTTATGVAAATVLAFVIAVGAYYAHFPEVYRGFARVTSPAAENATAPPAPSPAVEPASTVPARSSRAVVLAVRGIGWPLLLLSLGGTVLVATAVRDRLSLALGAWGVAAAAFLAFRVLAPVDVRYQRYADEFIERVYYAVLPAMAILAGRAAVWSWRRGALTRVAGAAVVLSAVAGAVAQWIRWIR